MSVTKTTETVPATTRTLEHVKCDGCGAEKGDPGWEREATWGKCSYVEVEVGYEMDGSREGIAWDFCPSCFETKVRPLLETIAKPRKVDETW